MRRQVHRSDLEGRLSFFLCGVPYDAQPQHAIIFSFLHLLYNVSPTDIRKTHERFTKINVLDYAIKTPRKEVVPEPFHYQMHQPSLSYIQDVGFHG